MILSRNPSGFPICCRLIACIIWGASLVHASSDPLLTDDQKRNIVDTMYEEYKNAFPELTDISPEAALKLMERGKKPVFVDIRTPKERKVSMLPGAITEEEFLERADTYKNHIVVGYCTIGYRSGKLADRLRKKGVSMLNLKGGLLAWVLAGGKVYDANGETKRIHVYGKKWNYPAKGYEAVW